MNTRILKYISFTKIFTINNKENKKYVFSQKILILKYYKYSTT